MTNCGTFEYSCSGKITIQELQGETDCRAGEEYGMM